MFFVFRYHMTNKKNKYLVPEYYKNFSCKCGDCRHPCCIGWPVRISMNEYFRLLGMNCSAKLRRKIDCAMRVCKTPNSECYAQLSDRGEDCALHRKDGLCAIQAELGEDFLPSICRLYPRNPRKVGDHLESSCSNSCEATIELLMQIKEPLCFEESDLFLQSEGLVPLTVEKYKICKQSIKLLQNRNQTFPQRVATLGNFLCGTNNIITKPDNLVTAFNTIHRITNYFENNSESVHDYCQKSLNYYEIDSFVALTEENIHDLTEKYRIAAEHLEDVYPDWQILMEQLVVNHLFYSNFPYTDSRTEVYDAFLSLVVFYSFLRFNLLGYMADKKDTDSMVDIIAAISRLTEHSGFHRIAVTLLKNEKSITTENVLELLYI